MNNYKNKIQNFCFTSEAIREAAKIFNPSFNVKIILKNVDRLDEMFIHEVKKDYFIDIIKLISYHKKNIDYDITGRIERDNEILDIIINDIKKEHERFLK